MNTLVSIMILFTEQLCSYSHRLLTLYLSTCMCAMKRNSVIFTKNSEIKVLLM